MHAADGKVRFSQLLSEPIDLSTGVAEHNGLCNGEAIETLLISRRTAFVPLAWLTYVS
jgi:hypothetical protein